MVVRVQRFPVMSRPFQRLFDLEHDVDGLFSNILSTSTLPRVREYPAIDLAEYENESIIVAEMPGVKKEDVKISLEDGTLTIIGERQGLSIPEGSSWLRSEIVTGKFSRAIQLPHEVHADGISAELTNGVLRVVLPKAEEARPREIKVK
jgi:HSP20 family protein